MPKTSLVEKSMNRSTLSRVRDRRLQHVVGADDVHAHRPHRALEHGVDAGDRGAVDDVRRAPRQLVHRVEIEDVRLLEREVRVVGEIRARECVPMQVVGGHDLVFVDQAARERRADESGAAGDEDPLALEHDGECIDALLYGPKCELQSLLPL